MKRLIILEMILMSFIWSPIVTANIYTWTDENNIRHFTNYAPPAGAEIFVRDLDIKPAFSPETPDEIEKNDSTAENQELKERLNDTQETLSETLEKVNALEDKIQNEIDSDLRAIEPEENVDSESVDNSSYSESGDTPKRSTYYYPAVIIRSGHFAKKSHYQSRISPHRFHKGGYYYKKQKFGKHHRQKSYYKKRHLKKHHLRNHRSHKGGYYYKKQKFGKHHSQKSYYKKRHHEKHKLRSHRYKKHRYENQHRRNRYFGRSSNRSHRVGVHQNRRNLELN